MFKIAFALYSCLINAFLAIFGNSILIFLIIRKSPKSMGNYKNLMLIFSLFGIFFALVDGTNQLMLHFYNGAYIIFSRNPLGLPRQVSFWYIALNCSCYGMILLLLVFHFVYRYFAVCRPQSFHLFSYPYFNFLIAIFVFVSLEWWILAIFVAGEDFEVEEHIRTTILENYGLDRLDYTYASSLFYKTNPSTGELIPSIPDFLFLANLAVIIISGFSVIIFCWRKLAFSLISKPILSSQKTLEMQRQLFKSLIVQTLVPIFLMFIPAGILLVFPIFRTNMGPIEVIILPLITTQPFMDSLVPIYFIRDYRVTVLKFFGKKSVNPVDDRSGTSRIFSVKT